MVAPKSEWLLPIKALIRILSTSSNEAQAIILLNVLTVAHTYPPALAPFARYFIVYTNEPKYIYDLKLEILEIIADASNRTFITNEFKVRCG